jgi:hypothetical protein
MAEYGLIEKGGELRLSTIYTNKYNTWRYAAFSSPSADVYLAV